MTEPNIPVAAIGKRGWHRSIAAKLLIAFGLIAALTVGASWLSLIRFNQVDAVMRQLTGVSLPLVKLSFSIESKTVKLVTSASELAESETDVEQFERMELLSGQVGELWGVLRDLQAIVADKATTIRLQQIVAALNGELGAIDRSTREFVQILIQRKRATEEVARIDAKLLAQLAPIVEQFGSRVAVALDRTDTASLDRETLKSDVALLRTVYAVRADINRMADLLNRIANASDSQGLSALKNQLVASRNQLRRDVATIENAAQRDAGPHAEFRRTIDSWIANATGESGVAALQTRYLQQRQAIAGQQKSLQTISDNLRNQVAALVQEAEREASATTERSAQAIERSRIWLVLIALASLLIAGLIVWLFVLRYVARRLTALADSMLAIARGELDTPIPAARADELGDMSRTLAVFRDNSREIRIARDEAEQAKAEAEAASRTKSSFLANMSHELRTPLNAIIGYSEILVEESVDNGDAAMVADLEKIQGAGKHLLGLINGILDLSKIEAGRMDVYLEQVHLARLVDEVRVIVEPLVAKNGSKLVTLCPPDIGSHADGSDQAAAESHQSLSNAAKFTKDGTITLAVSRAVRRRRPGRALSSPYPIPGSA